MSLKEKIIKIASGIFMAFIVLLIVIAFGMPDFITTSAEAKKNLIARVESLNIYPYDVGLQKQALLDRFGQESFPESLSPFIEKQALENAINEKLFFLLAQKSHLIPRGKAKELVLKKYYQENLSHFFKEGKFDFDDFEKMLQRQNRTRVDFDKKLIEQKSMLTLDELLRNIRFTSRFEALENLRLKNSKVRFKILVLTQAKKEELILKTINIPESEIVARFQRDYLAKDPKDKLTPTKREAIIKQLKNEKREEAASKFIAQLNLRKSLQEISQFTGEKIAEIKDYTLADKLDTKKPKGWVSLDPLQKSAEWTKLVLAKKGEIFSIVADGNHYFLEVVDFSGKNYPLAQELLNRDAKDPLFDELKKEMPEDFHHNYVYMAMNKLFRDKTTIRYYKQKT